MRSSKNLTSRSPKGSSPNRGEEVSIISRGTPPYWLMRWKLAANLTDRLEMVGHSRVTQEPIRRYANESML